MTIWLTLWLLAHASSQDIQFSYSVRPEKIQPGERATLEIRLEDPKLSVEEVENWQPELEENLLNEAKTLTLLDRQVSIEGKTWVWRFQVTSYDIGTLTLPAVGIKLGPQTFSTERKTIEVHTLRKSIDQEMRADLGKIPPPYGLWILSTIAIATLAYFIWRRLKKIALPQMSIPKKEATPIEWLYQRYLAWMARYQKNPQDPTLLDQMSQDLRMYWEKSFQLDTPYLSAHEIDRLDFTLPESLVECLLKIDEWRFAKNKRWTSEGLSIEFLKHIQSELKSVLKETSA